jgi:thiol-disulfide isomerase/thioredoxin
MLRAACLAALILLPSFAFNFAQIPPIAIPAMDPRAAKLMAEGKDFEKREQLTSAVDSYRAANKAAGGSCEDCLQALFALQMRMPVYKDAAATAVRLEDIALDAAAKTTAEVGHAQALLFEYEQRPKRGLLDDANRVLLRAETNTPNGTAVMMLRGRVLALQEDNEAASKEFLAYAKLLNPDNPLAKRALHFAENPQLARKRLAPDFTVKTHDGQTFSLAQAIGKVVMIDFWATWCGPCQQELPYVKDMAEDFDKKDVVMLSVSWDESQDAWERYLREKKMVWLQYRDADSRMRQRFNISAIPTYILIDRDGVVRRKAVGGMLDIRSDLNDLVAGKSIPADTETKKD